MVRVSSTGLHSDYLKQPRQLIFEQPTGRRGHSIDNQWGWCDLPIRLSDSGNIGPYELQVMMNWGSMRAWLTIVSEGWLHELGLRASIGLARENP